MELYEKRVVLEVRVISSHKSYKKTLQNLNVFTSIKVMQTPFSETNLPSLIPRTHITILTSPIRTFHKRRKKK